MITEATTSKKQAINLIEAEIFSLRDQRNKAMVLIATLRSKYLRYGNDEILPQIASAEENMSVIRQRSKNLEEAVILVNSGFAN
jgi:hypothetical protein